MAPDSVRVTFPELSHGTGLMRPGELRLRHSSNDTSYQNVEMVEARSLKKNILTKAYPPFLCLIFGRLLAITHFIPICNLMIRLGILKVQ